jgi:hypothetical protein
MTIVSYSMTIVSYNMTIVQLLVPDLGLGGLSGACPCQRHVSRSHRHGLSHGIGGVGRFPYGEAWQV